MILNRWILSGLFVYIYNYEEIDIFPISNIALPHAISLQFPSGLLILGFHVDYHACWLILKDRRYYNSITWAPWRPQSTVTRCWWFNSLFRLTSIKTSKLRITVLCEGDPSVDSTQKGPVMRKEFPCHDVIMDVKAIKSPVQNRWGGSTHMILAYMYVYHLILPDQAWHTVLRIINSFVCYENVIFDIHTSYLIYLPAVISC